MKRIKHTTFKYKSLKHKPVNQEITGNLSNQFNFDKRNMKMVMSHIHYYSNIKNRYNNVFNQIYSNISWVTSQTLYDER